MTEPTDRALEALQKGAGWVIGFAILQIVVGVLAIAAPQIATLATAVFLGWLLLFAGVAQLVHAFQVRGWKGFGLHALGAAFYTLGGILVIARPLAGAISLTLIVSLFLAVEGAGRVGIALQHRPEQGWLGLLVGGALGVLLGAMLFLELPSSALWALGLLLGVNLVVSGSTLLGLGMAARRTGAAAGSSA